MKLSYFDKTKNKTKHEENFKSLNTAYSLTTSERREK